MEKVIVLGASGQLGQDIQTETASDSIEIIPITRKEFDADIMDASEAVKQFPQADYLINCIAYHKVDECEDNPEKSFKINAQLVKQLAEFSQEQGMTFIHFSTDYVFDGYDKKPYIEQDYPGPLNIYGNSKLAGEMAVKAYAEKYFIFRISALFGAKGISSWNVNFVEKMINAAQKKMPLKVIDNQFTSPTYTKDVALMLRHIIENKIDSNGLYHAVNSGECSWFQFAKKIFDICTINTDIEPVSYNQFHTHAKRPQYCSLDNSKLGSIFKMRNWEDALEDYLKLKGYC